MRHGVSGSGEAACGASRPFLVCTLHQPPPLDMEHEWQLLRHAFTALLCNMACICKVVAIGEGPTGFAFILSIFNEIKNGEFSKHQLITAPTTGAMKL